MKKIRFILIDEVHRAYAYIVEEFGGNFGISDEGKLLAALDQPKTGIDGEYVHKDLYEMAAAYLYHIVRAQPFTDGNKRLGGMLALQFLGLNGIEVVTTTSEFQRMIKKVANGEIGKPEIAEFFWMNSRPEEE